MSCIIINYWIPTHSYRGLDTVHLGVFIIGAGRHTSGDLGQLIAGYKCQFPLTRKIISINIKIIINAIFLLTTTLSRWHCTWERQNPLIHLPESCSQFS